MRGIIVLFLAIGATFADTEITKAECSVANEEYIQCASCEATCDNKKPVCAKVCQPPRCMCKIGFYRTSEGKCVAEQHCPVAATAPTPRNCSLTNEEYKECAGCEPSCKNKNPACVMMCQPPRCMCKKGFYRNDKGICVAEKECPVVETLPALCFKANEEFRECATCEATCNNKTPMCNKACQPPRCMCQSGFFRNEKGNCVAEKECPVVETLCSRVNEEFKQCATCEPSCKNKNPICIKSCQAPRCMCKAGFYRNDKGICVAEKECPVVESPWLCAKANEEYRECASCEPSCQNKNPICNKMCQSPRCMCEPGFYRNLKGECVKELQCITDVIVPIPKCTRENEEFRRCASACEPTCKNKDQIVLCVSTCKPPACQCKIGYYRADDGKCVPEEECVAPTSQCSKNESFTTCSTMCEPRCGEIVRKACVKMCGPPKCQCMDGFYRTAKGDCVTKEDCETPSMPQCKKNQVYAECSSTCVPKCGEYELRPCMAMCGPPKCQCAQGFYLDNRGECVTRKECDAQPPKKPDQSDCKPNELFRECSSMCEPKCGKKEEMVCPAVCGPPKCQCDNGFLRNDKGECVLKKECEPRRPTIQVDCGPNMTFRNCSSPCQSKCGEYTKKGCIERCDPPKCECNEGFYFNSVGDCVSREDCENEVALTCDNIECNSGTECKMIGGKPTCVRLVLTCATVKCAGGSRCEITPEGSPKCIPDVALTCDNVDCKSGSVCKMENGKPICVRAELTCATVKCAGGSRCEITPEGTPKCIPESPQVDPIKPKLGCQTVKCSAGHHCAITKDGTAKCVPDGPLVDPIGPKMTCANVRCAGPCTDTPTGPRCGPRPEILPIEVGPSDATKPQLTCKTVKCAGGCTDTPDGPKCSPRPEVLPIEVGPSSAPDAGKPARTCENIGCAGPCAETTTGPVCAQVLPARVGPTSSPDAPASTNDAPRPQVLPINVGPSSSPVAASTEDVRRPQVLPIEVGPKSSPDASTAIHKESSRPEVQPTKVASTSAPPN